MASDKFGNNPVAPLYNATGRNPRDLDMGNPGKPLGSVGSSGIGGKDFGTPGKSANPTTLGAVFGQWNNPLSVLGQMNNRLYGDGGGGGGGGGQIDVEATERLWKAAPTTINNFAPQAGGNQDNRGMNAQIAEGGRQVIDAQYTEKGDNNSGITQTTTIEGTPPGAQPAKVKTEAQKSRDRETAKARRALKSDIQKSGTTEQKERIAKEGLTGRKKSTTNTPSTRKPRSASAKSGTQPMTTATQRVGNITQTQTFGGNL